MSNIGPACTLRVAMEKMKRAAVDGDECSTSWAANSSKLILTSLEGRDNEILQKEVMNVGISLYNMEINSRT